MENKELMQSISKNNLTAVSKWLEAHSSADAELNFLIDVPGLGEVTPLMYAAHLGHIEIVKSLLRQPGDIDPSFNHETKMAASDYRYKTALACADYAKKTEVIDVLIADPRIKKFDLSIALIYYTSINQLEKVKECLIKGADVNFKHLGTTALHEAAFYGCDAIAELLLENSAVEVNLTNRYCETPLIVAIAEEHAGIAQLLLKQPNIDLTIKSYYHGTALTAAIYFGQFELADKIIISLPFPITNAQHPDALTWAIRAIQPKLVEALLDKGFDPNNIQATDYAPIPPNLLKEGGDHGYEYAMHPQQTRDLPLVWAVHQSIYEPEKIIEIINKLAAVGADPNKVNKRGESAFSLCKEAQIYDEITGKVKPIPAPVKDLVKKLVTDNAPNRYTFFAGLRKLPVAAAPVGPVSKKSTAPET